MLSLSSMIVGKDKGDKVALLTDGRFSGGTYGLVVGHIAPGSSSWWTDCLPPVQVIWLQLTRIPKKSLCMYQTKSWRNVKQKLSLPPLYSRGVLGKYAPSFHQHHVVRLLTSGIWINQVKLNHIL